MTVQYSYAAAFPLVIFIVCPFLTKAKIGHYQNGAEGASPPTLFPSVIFIVGRSLPEANDSLKAKVSLGAEVSLGGQVRLGAYVSLGAKVSL